MSQSTARALTADASRMTLGETGALSRALGSALGVSACDTPRGPHPPCSIPLVPFPAPRCDRQKDRHD